MERRENEVRYELFDSDSISKRMIIDFEEISKNVDSPQAKGNCKGRNI
ncbi:MAG: hypothetical protein QXJ68_08560 [Methanocellales archaeon]